MSDHGFYIRAVEKWFIRNDPTFQDVDIFIGRQEPVFRKTRVTIKIKTNCLWEEYIEVLKAFKTFIKRVFIPYWSYEVNITVLHTKKIRS